MPEANVLVPGARPAGARRPALIRVLVIDPYPVTRVRLKDSLRSLEFVESVGEKTSPQGVVELLGDIPYSMVMIDEEVGDVFETIKELRRHPAGQKPIYLLVVSQLTEDLQRQGQEAGVRGFLTKPFDLGGVERAVRSALAPPAPAAAAAAPAGAPEGLRDTLAKLRQVALFHAFSDPELVRLLKICRSRNLAAGELVFPEGAKGDALYVVVSGRVDIKKKIGAEHRLLVSMHPGDCFGEMAIVDDSPRMADAVAAEKCSLIEVSASIINNNEDIISLKLTRQIAILLAKKLRAQSQK
jgi:DNA-binding NarL/FixJ family response regulator